MEQRTRPPAAWLQSFRLNTKPTAPPPPVLGLGAGPGWVILSICKHLSRTIKYLACDSGGLRCVGHWLRLTGQEG